MKNNGFFELFIDQMGDMYSSERQIIKALPKLIKLATFNDLRDALSSHLKETENQVRRIEKIYSILDINPAEETCEAMEGLVKEADEMVRNKTKGAVLDAAIIAAAQKVEHYEMASYGSLRTWAKFLELDSEIVDLLQDTLDEEGAADKRLTKIADGSIFTTGVNQEAAEPTIRRGKR